MARSWAASTGAAMPIKFLTTVAEVRVRWGVTGFPALNTHFRFFLVKEIPGNFVRTETHGFFWFQILILNLLVMRSHWRKRETIRAMCTLPFGGVTGESFSGLLILGAPFTADSRTEHVSAAPVSSADRNVRRGRRGRLPASLTVESDSALVEVDSPHLLHRHQNFVLAEAAGHNPAASACLEPASGNEDWGFQVVSSIY